MRWQKGSWCMRSKKPTVTIGIPAFNEEKNIESLLEKIHTLKSEKNYEIKEVIVILDGSTDHTYQKIKNLDFSELKTLRTSVRQGKALSLNKIFDLFKGDILVLLDADIKLKSDALQNIIDCFAEEESIELVGGNVTPIRYSSLIQKFQRPSINITTELRKSLKNGNNIFCYHGAFLALKKEFAKTLRLPATIGTDAFIFLFCKQAGKQTKYCSEAIAYINLPENLDDYIKRSLRFESSKQIMKEKFINLASKEYEIPLKKLVFLILIEFFINPFETIGYCGLILCSLFVGKKKGLEEYGKATWDIAQSTKFES